MKFRILLPQDVQKVVEVEVGTGLTLSEVREIIKEMPDMKDNKFWVFQPPEGEEWYDPEDEPDILATVANLNNEEKEEEEEEEGEREGEGEEEEEKDKLKAQNDELKVDNANLLLENKKLTLDSKIVNESLNDTSLNLENLGTKLLEVKRNNDSRLPVWFQNLEHLHVEFLEYKQGCEEKASQLQQEVENRLKLAAENARLEEEKEVNEEELAQVKVDLEEATVEVNQLMAVNEALVDERAASREELEQERADFEREKEELFRDKQQCERDKERLEGLKEQTELPNKVSGVPDTTRERIRLLESENAELIIRFDELYHKYHSECLHSRRQESECLARISKIVDELYQDS